jgi:hypothetical protein
LWVLRRTGHAQIRLHRLRESGSVLLLASGAWVIVAVLLYNSVLLGYGARWHAMPYLPIAVGLAALLVGALGAIEWRPGADRRLASWIVAAIGVALLASAPARMILNQQPALGVAEVRAMQSATVEIEQRAGSRPVAFLAYDTLSRHHVRYYAALAGRPNLSTFEQLAAHAGDPIDLDQPLRNTDRPEELRERLDRTLRTYADFVLVYTDTDRYEDPRELLWPYQLGKPVVDGLLSDPAWTPVARFTLRERDLVLLEHTAKPVRSASGAVGASR